MNPSDQVEGPFLTMTHARLLIHQGDFGSAVLVLKRLIRERPQDEAARRLLRSLERRGVPLEPPKPSGLTERSRRPPRRVAPPPGVRRRIERLEAWLRRIRRSA